MHEGLLELLDQNTRTRVAGAPTSQLLDVDIKLLDLPAATQDMLRRLDVHKISELENVDLAQLELTRRIREILVCALFYPRHDPGPGCAWEQLFEEAPAAEYQNTGLFHTHYGPVFYRGRLNGRAQVLVIGQDPSTDETLAGRILVDASGQRTQKFLEKIGITRSYLMLNTFLFGIQSTNIPAGLETTPAFTTVRPGDPSGPSPAPCREG